MVVLRIALIVVGVVALDIGVLFFGVGDPDAGWGKVWRAADTQYDHPLAENQRALDAAQQEYEKAQRPRAIILSCPLFLSQAAGSS
jgi:hypothetical protein